MHFTEPLYRSPYWPTWPLIEITRGCTHNKCKFCTMYKGVKFGVQSMEIIEEDLAELARTVPDARTIQLIGANPLALPTHRLVPISEKINEYLPRMECIYTSGRVTDLRNKTADDLKKMRGLGLKVVFLGTESGDDWTLDRINKGYGSSEIIEAAGRLREAGIELWVIFLVGAAGRQHSHDHAVNTAKVFNQIKPFSVGTGGLTLFPGSALGEEAARGEFEPLSEKEMLIEMRTFVEKLDRDCQFITHHTVTGANMTGPNFLGRKEEILTALDNEIECGDFDRYSALRRQKITL